MSLSARFDAPTMGAESLTRILELTHGPIEAHMPRDFLATARSNQQGEVTIGRVAAPPNSARGGAEHHRGTPGGGFLICIAQLDGTLTITQAGRTVRLTTGDFGFYTTDRPYELRFDDHYELIAVCFPIEWSRAYGPAGAAALCATRLAHSDPLAASLGPAVEALEHHLDELAPGIRVRVIGQILNAVELIGTTVSGAQAPERGEQSDLLQHALNDIEHRLTDTTLSPATIAARLYVSERTLYAAFREAGLSIAGAIRTRRLEHARRDLIDPANANMPISAISSRWGFSTGAHFSVLFRDFFGSTPSAYRAQHLE